MNENKEVNEINDTDIYDLDVSPSGFLDGVPAFLG